ncbi:acyltransferase [Wenzhouxiangella sp. XN24]|uniref:acyltransferase n=1 Tax=Wenzhouxiangella sp. XN24 TaxID=2713569 RepID=UPI0013ECA164|nr:acyltransferase [Wenzhouxiangella sp. XN24]NGX16858.1 acyltransferase [Wenzhouxiangella sp. XN24]
MKLVKAARRFLVPAFLRTLIYGLKYRAYVSPRAEVDFTPNLRLGKGVVISAFTKLKATDGPVTIGARSAIGPGCFISSGTQGITIGSDVMVAANSAMVANNHRYDRVDVPMNQQGHTSLGIQIGDDVWIGANSVVLDGASIQAGTIVTAGSVVSSKIGARKIVTGNPAKAIFERR